MRHALSISNGQTSHEQTYIMLNSGKIILEIKHQKLQHAHALARKLGIKHNSQTQSKSDMHENMARLYAMK